MGTLDIRIYGDPVLRAKAAPIREITPDHHRLAGEMAETMYAAHGIGLAANQVGVLERIIMVDVNWARGEEDKRPPKNPIAMINPEILEESVEDAPYDEGCLSIPEITGEVWRPERIKVRYTRLDGGTEEQECSGLLARCIQHEIDHLNGTLFVDRMGRLKRALLMKKLDRTFNVKERQAQKA